MHLLPMLPSTLNSYQIGSHNQKPSRESNPGVTVKFSPIFFLGGQGGGGGGGVEGGTDWGEIYRLLHSW